MKKSRELILTLSLIVLILLFVKGAIFTGGWAIESSLNLSAIDLIFGTNILLVEPIDFSLVGLVSFILFILGVVIHFYQSIDSKTKFKTSSILMFVSSVLIIVFPMTLFDYEFIPSPLLVIIGLLIAFIGYLNRREYKVLKNINIEN